VHGGENFCIPTVQHPSSAWLADANCSERWIFRSSFARGNPIGLPGLGNRSPAGSQLGTVATLGRRSCIGAVPSARPTDRRIVMNNDQIAGKWKQLKGEAKIMWGKLTDDELDQAEGHKDKLAGMIQERYGRTKEEAEKEVNSFFERY
jgi:uncharacterized protein YjbJ (UPF0337 family)